MKKLLVDTKSQKYPIIIGNNLISNISKIISKNSISFRKCLLVVDRNVPKKKINKIKSKLKGKENYFYFIRASEKNKNQNNVNKILEILLRRNFSRQDCLITIGGGITGDLGGYAASLFKRGLQFINLPTTLLSQVDSSIGGKTGINTKYGKNLVGTFYQPKLVVSDIDFLKTLPKREIICGYGEILKHSLISNKNFFKFLNTNFFNIINLKSPFIEKAINESCKIKKKVVEKDEREKNLRKILNFGHTFAHAFEASLGFSKKLNHGEAVILGMNAALKFSLEKNIIKLKEYQVIKDHINNSKLPFHLKDYFNKKDINKIISFMIKDKKNSTNKINLVLLKKIGLPISSMNFDKKHLQLFFQRQLNN